MAKSLNPGHSILRSPNGTANDIQIVSAVILRTLGEERAVDVTLGGFSI